eukprot:TRINITY_DN6941_c0_g1_i1.p1 TRINITY_DN6941_c0_g1~~TRINITY_DN6941_c0_g1_i1.p1  ORF type:complete len:786 (+),score=259.78 TRINITY_DN6941_c0_g1_i1:237-2360(+)
MSGGVMSMIEPKMERKINELKENNNTKNKKKITKGRKELNENKKERKWIQYASFYKYVFIPSDQLQSMRISIGKEWKAMGVEGRIYIDQEGINAQITVPILSKDSFIRDLRKRDLIGDSKIVWGDEIEAIDEKTHYAESEKNPHNRFDSNPTRPFRSLHVRIRSLIADGLEADHIVTDNVTQSKARTKPASLPYIGENGNNLKPNEWHNEMISNQGKEKPILIDVRNSYESEVGRFEGAIRLSNNKFGETFEEIEKIIQERDINKNSKIMLYCTGGIRCEKVAGWLSKDKGFKNVSKLEGGINNYINFAKRERIPSLFKGKNYVFDTRMADESVRVTEDVLSNCNICNKPGDIFYNCKNKHCNTLFIQCKECAEKRKENHTCSKDCDEFLSMDPEDQEIICKHYNLPKRRTFTTPNAKFEIQTARKILMEQKKASKEDLSAEAISTNEEGARFEDQILSSNQLAEYVDKYSSSDFPLADEIDKQVKKEIQYKHHMLIGPTGGNLLKMMVRSTKAKDVLEIGTFVGYSALWMAEGLPEGGKIITCESSHEYAALAQQNFDKHHRKDDIQLIIGSAEYTLNQLEKEGKTFDFIFLDANKGQYSYYYQFLITKGMLRKNGILLVDNTLWKGRVVNPNKDSQSIRMHKFNDFVRRDERTIKSIVPLRDGMTMIMHDPLHFRPLMSQPLEEESVSGQQPKSRWSRYFEKLFK